MNPILNLSFEIIEKVPKKLLHKGKHTSVHWLTGDYQEYVLKVLEKEFPTHRDIGKFYLEYEYSLNPIYPGVRQAVAKGKINNKPAILFNYVPGIPLNKFKSEPWNPKEFLPVAIQLVKILGQVHEHKLIHRDLKPQNIIINPETREITLIDFSSATKLTSEKKNIQAPTQLEGTLQYLAPEMTGRMNRSLDYRSDLYSLGVIFYELLTGNLPFTGEDALHLIHSHLAINPDVSSIEPPLAQIVDKLMAKNAESRYQSTFGLMHDLEQCLELLDKFGSLLVFPIAQKDFSPVFNLPQNLYGRKLEIEVLLNAYEQASQGDLRYVLISGYSGVGKTALVNETHKPLTRNKGFFTTGKFDQFQRNIPYSALLQAIRGMVQQLLLENPESFKNWKTKITSTLGNNGKIISDLVPNLKLIIGDPLEVPSLPPLEAKIRFIDTFLSFLRLLARPDHPLIIFIDDLQWCDTASLDMISAIINDHEINHCLLIGAYRDNEVDESHPLTSSIKEIKAIPDILTEISLNPLKLEHINQMVLETLKGDPVECAELGQLVYEKTHGNPFFANQFLLKLYHDNLIRHNRQVMKWQWEIEVIKALNITDNVVELMIQKLETLPQNTQEVLKYAACIGNVFDLDMLSDMTNQPKREIVQALSPSVEEGLTPPLDDTFRIMDMDEELPIQFNGSYQFLHDRLQQASYTLIPEKTRSKVHLSIGTHLLENLSEEQINQKIFEVVNHLNIGIKYEKDQEIIDRLISMNIQAGKRAKSSLAYNTASDLFDNAKALLSAGYWDSDTYYPMAYDIFIEQAECKYLDGHHEDSESLMNTLITHANNSLEKARVYILKGVLYQTQGKFLEELETCKNGLELFGTTIPSAVSGEELMASLAELDTLRNGKSVPELIDLPILQDPEQYIIQTLFIIASTPTYMTDKTKLVWTWVITEIIKISLKHGNSPLSELAYSGFGVVLGSMGDYKTGYEYGKLSYDLNKRFDNRGNIPKINVIYGQMVAPWMVPLREVLPLARQGMDKAYESGDLIYGAYGGLHHLWGHLFIGTSLAKIEEDAKTVIQFFEKTKDIFIDSPIVAQQYVAALKGDSDQLASMSALGYSDLELESKIEQVHVDFPKHNYYLVKLILDYLNYDYQSALKQIPNLESTAYAVQGCLFLADQNFYHSLCLISAFAENSNDKEEIIATIEQNQQKMAVWASNCPANFASKHLLVEAEKEHYLNNNYPLAESLYDQAIQAATTNQMIREEALANERAAMFFHERNRFKITKAYLKDAIKAYSEWGAFGKIRQLQSAFPDFSELFSVLDEKMLTLDTLRSTTFASGGDLLDWQSVAKSTTAISGEVVLEKLLKKLVWILIEAAGAEKCFLIQISSDPDQKFVVEASGTVHGMESEVLQNLPATPENIPIEILHFVERTREPLVLPDAIVDDRFNQSLYIRHNQIRSLACVPIILQDKITGIIYLENNLSSEVFTQDRLEILKLLAAQTAISMENAVLYRDLEAKVVERTQTIESQKEIIELEKNKADELLYNILPRSTANELKSKGFSEPKSFDSVTTLFTDFVGFTGITEKISPRELIDDLNICFMAFDEISSQNGMERIKTIGDSYMCAGGIPVENFTHAVDGLRTAISIQKFINKWNESRREIGKTPWLIRIGLHTGPVIAGVVGKKRFVYDIWGDSVNIASRMEASSEPGEINISESTYQLVKDQFTCEYRGKITAKNKGEIDMYFVKGYKS